MNVNVIETPTNEDPNEPDAGGEKPAMSKTQMKKLKKMTARREIRKERRAKEKARRKEKRRALQEAGKGKLLKRPELRNMSTSNCPIHVAIDMSYQQLMNEELLRKTILQLNFAYGVNRRAHDPMQYHIVNINGRTRTVFNSFPGYSEWDVFMHEESVAELWAPKEVVYLTSDSPRVLVDLDPNKVYVIGGLLDHNAYPGASLKKAEQNGFDHARLPIDEYVKLQTRKILTINQVFEILLRFYETKSWETAFFNVIPKRKGMKKRNDIVNVDASKRVGIGPSSTQGVIEIRDESQAYGAQSSSTTKPIEVIDLVDE